jgi:serine/threonine-protein kinase
VQDIKIARAGGNPVLAPTLSAGDRVGDWIIERPLGRGGMSAVYVGRNLIIADLIAAIKVIKPGHDLDTAERFLREVRSTVLLNHPNVVRVTGFGQDEARGLLWMAMDLVEGGALDHRLLAGPLPFAELADLFQGLAEALAHAHELGISHRDIKPSNILLDGARAKLADFGIAVQQRDSRLTRTGLVVGTPAYLAPEVFRGETLDPARGDLYAFGQVLLSPATTIRAFPSITWPRPG